MSLFKQRKNKTFNLSSRFSDKVEAKDSSEFSQQWEEARGTNTKRKRGISLGMLFVLLVILLTAMFYIEKNYL